MKTAIPTKRMQSLSEYFKRDSVYFGERSDWLVAYVLTRDGDTLACSNWECFVAKLGGESECVAIERASHWAIGWIDYLIVSPAAAEIIAKANEILADLENYPVVNESHWSDKEFDEYCTFFTRDAANEFERQLRELTVSERFVEVVSCAPIEALQEWFEAQISSGEYQHDGYPCFSLAFDRVTRTELAQLIWKIRKAKQ